MIRPPVSTPSAPDVASTQRDAQRAVAKSIAATPLIDLRTVKQPAAAAPAGDVWTPSARLVTLATGGAQGNAPPTPAAAVEVAVEAAPVPPRDAATVAMVDDPAVSTDAHAEARAPAPRDAATREKAVAVALEEATHPEAPSPARALPAPVRDAREFGREPRARAPLARGAAYEASTVAGEVPARARRGPEVEVARVSSGEAQPAVARSREGAAARASLTVAELEAHVDARGVEREAGARLAAPGAGLVEGVAVGFAPGVAPRVDATDAARDAPALGWIALFREAPRRIQRRPLLWLVVVLSWAAVLVAAWYATAR